MKWNARMSRRSMLAGAGGLGAAMATGPAKAQVQSSPAAMGLAIRKITGGATVTPGKVTLEVPPLSENGNSVAASIAVDSPMTAKDHVKAIHVLAERNPQPHVISVQLGPRAGKANISTRMRLADTQNVTAIAEMSDGTFWSDSGLVIITIGACLEDMPG